jgi:hypothetical protein
MVWMLAELEHMAHVGSSCSTCSGGCSSATISLDWVIGCSGSGRYPGVLCSARRARASMSGGHRVMAGPAALLNI